jgi:hypothetical protein
MLAFQINIELKYKYDKEINMQPQTSKPGTTFLTEFEDFTAFLQNLWGVLAGVSILFPLSNVFTKIIPLETFDSGGALVWFSPQLFTTIATVVSLFLILSTFGQRDNFQSTKKRATIKKQTWISFVIGLAMLTIYLAGYYFIAINAYDTLGWESADSRRLIGEIPLFVSYGSFFALLTRAFVMLAMLEFFKRGKASS